MPPRHVGVHQVADGARRAVGGGVVHAPRRAAADAQQRPRTAIRRRTPAQRAVGVHRLRPQDPDVPRVDGRAILLGDRLAGGDRHGLRRRLAGQIAQNGTGRELGRDDRAAVRFDLDMTAADRRQRVVDRVVFILVQGLAGVQLGDRPPAAAVVRCANSRPLSLFAAPPDLHGTHEIRLFREARLRHGERQRRDIPVPARRLRWEGQRPFRRIGSGQDGLLPARDTDLRATHLQHPIRGRDPRAARARPAGAVLRGKVEPEVPAVRQRGPQRVFPRLGQERRRGPVGH